MHTKRFNVLFHETKGFKKPMIVADEKITPELAKDLLTLNTGNRPVTNSIVNKYATEMTNNKWTFIGDTVGISTDGILLNGQHRLLAIIRSNTSQVFHVQCGLDPEAFNKMDTGKLRSAGDTLAMQGYVRYGMVSTIVRYVSVFNSDLLADYIGTTSKFKFSNQDISDEAAKLDRELLQAAATAATRYYGRAKFMDTTTVGPLFYILSKIDSEAAYNFFDMLSTGDGIGTENYSSIYLLRNKLMNSSISGNKINTRHKWVIYFKAWNYFLEGKPMKQLTYNEREPFPKPTQRAAVAN